MHSTGPARANHVGWTLQDTLAATANLRPTPEARAPEFTHRENDALEVNAAGWSLAQGALHMRYARVQGAVADVLTIMIYPGADPERLPVFAVEWVVLGPRVHVAVLDVEPLQRPGALAAELDSVFADLGEQWQSRFPTKAETPAWFAEIASPFAVYSECGIDEIDDLREAYRAYLQRCVEHFYEPRVASAKRGEEDPRVLRYKAHHDEHSPGRKILAPKFGASWTDDFLACHFGPAR